MPKTSVDQIKGISPVAKKISFQAEKNDQEVEVSLYIYPFTTKEKIELKQMQKELDKTKDEEKELDYTFRIVHMILKKSIEGLTIEDVKNNIPTSWFESIIDTALEFENIDQEQLQSLKKKATEQVQE